MNKHIKRKHPDHNDHNVDRRPEVAPDVTTDVTIDQDRELYVIPAAGGYSCLGFDVLTRRTRAVTNWLREHGRKGRELSPELSLRVSPELLTSLRGTPQAYAIYLETMRQGEALNRETGNRCNVDLTPQLIGMEGKRVEIVDRYGETRRFWVGKSTGWFPVHLEIARRDSSGGGAVTGAPFQSVRIIRNSGR